jgi:four helix bundle protein
VFFKNSGMNKPHKKLNLWSDAVDLAQQIYTVTERFPSNEQFGLTSQVRRAAVSIPSNIAEGAARQTKKEFLNFLHIAKGSLSELDTQIEIARRLEYLDQARWEALDERLERIDRMLSGLVRSLRRRNNP